MASISTRTLTKSAAVAGALGLAFALGAPAANAQTEGADLGSLSGILSNPSVAGSLTGSLSGSLPGEGDSGSTDQIGGLLTPGSIATGVGTVLGSSGTAQGSSGPAASLGDVAGTLDPNVVGEVISGSIQSLSADGGATSSLGEVSAASIGEILGTGSGTGTTP